MTAPEFKRQVDRCHRLSELTALLNTGALVIADTATARNEALEYGFARREKLLEDGVAIGARGAAGGSFADN